MFDIVHPPMCYCTVRSVTRPISFSLRTLGDKNRFCGSESLLLATSWSVHVTCFVIEVEVDGAFSFPLFCHNFMHGVFFLFCFLPQVRKPRVLLLDEATRYIRYELIEVRSLKTCLPMSFRLTLRSNQSHKQGNTKAWRGPIYSADRWCACYWCVKQRPASIYVEAIIVLFAISPNCLKISQNLEDSRL